MNHRVSFQILSVNYVLIALMDLWNGLNPMGAIACGSIFYVGGVLAKMIEDKESGE